MVLPKQLTTVTPLSKYLAMALFILLPFLAFSLGIKYQKLVTPVVPMSAVPNNPKERSAVPVHTNSLVQWNLLALIKDKSQLEKRSITQINSLSVSYDSKRICFLAGRDSTAAFIYIVDSDGENLKEIGIGAHCVWSYDNKMVAFNAKHADGAPYSLAYYDIMAAKLSEPTPDKAISVDAYYLRTYGIPSWSPDSRLMLASYYDDLNAAPLGASKVDIRTNIVTDLDGKK